MDTARAPRRQYRELLDARCWELLGLTGQEFLRGYYLGDYRGTTDPAARALVEMVESGRAVAWGPAFATVDQ
jgi:hypothetical protein